MPRLQACRRPKIVARLIRGVDKAPTPEQRQRLQVKGRERVNYRRVQLRCGRQVLSEAENWYVPSRLTAGMNRLLETTDTPFGKAIQALQPYRQNLTLKCSGRLCPKAGLASPPPGAQQTLNRRACDPRRALRAPRDPLHPQAQTLFRGLRGLSAPDSGLSPASTGLTGTRSSWCFFVSLESSW